jgi:hypothetical protein
MSVYTMFQSLNVLAYESDTVDDARFAKQFANFLHDLKFNVLNSRAEYLYLDAAEQRDYTLFTGFSLTDWWILYAKVAGEARFSLTYDDPLNPGTEITSNLTAYGTDNLPGFYCQSLVGLTPDGATPAIRITGLANGTKIMFLFAQAAADNNANWIANK